MTIIKTVALTFTTLVLLVSLIGYLSTAVQIVDLTQTAMSGDVEQAASAIKNFTETQVLNEINGAVRGMYIAVALAILSAIVTAVLALFKR